MKTRLFPLLVTFISLSVSAQINFQETIIADNGDGIVYAKNVYPADLDGDGDLDVLASSSGGAFWFENTDGQGTFDIQHNIDTASTNSISANDIDGDGDMDIIYVFNGAITALFWCENIDGLGSFGEIQPIASTSYDYFLYSNNIADMDGDGDLDITYIIDIVPANIYNLYWCENTDGHGSFTSHLVSGYELFDHVTDIDGDDDMDIVTLSLDGIAWFENTDGQGNFLYSRFVPQF